MLKKIACCIALIPTYSSCNIIIPALATLGYMYNLFGLKLAILSMIAEFIAFKLLIKASWLRALTAAFCMNLVSTLVGSFALLAYDSVALFTFASEAIVGKTLIYYALGFFIFSVLINTIIETFIALLFFPHIKPSRLIWIVVTVNALSVAIGLGGVGLYFYWYGHYPM